MSDPHRVVSRFKLVIGYESKAASAGEVKATLRVTLAIAKHSTLIERLRLTYLH